MLTWYSPLDTCRWHLDFSTIEAGKLHLEVIDFDLHTTVREGTELFIECARSKGLGLACVIRPAVPAWVSGDPGRLRQVLTNLISNGVKFTESGEVTLRVSLEQENEREAVVHFEVTDTGIGIPQEVQERLFEAFSQADTSTTRRFGGTGLGLAISKQLVELTGGVIGVDSTPGIGSTFWFIVLLPKTPRPSSVAVPSDIALSASPSGHHRYIG